MSLRSLLLCATLIAFLLGISPVWAGTITFSGAGAQGEMRFMGEAGNSLTIGTDFSGNLGAAINSIASQFAICNPSCGITGPPSSGIGYLTLMTGSEISEPSPGHYMFGPSGGSGGVYIYGAIPALGIPNGTKLFSAQFSSATFNSFASMAMFYGTLNPSSIYLNPALGTFQFANGGAEAFSIDLNANCDGPGGCAGLVLSDSVTVTANPISEPVTLSVLVAGLFALGAGLRKKPGAWRVRSRS